LNKQLGKTYHNFNFSIFKLHITNWIRILTSVVQVPARNATKFAYTPRQINWNDLMQLTRKTSSGWCPFPAEIQMRRNMNSFIISQNLGGKKASTNQINIYTIQKPFKSYLVNPFIFTAFGIKCSMLETSQLQCKSRTTLLHV